ncbi:MAG: hypothetical protein ACERIH_07040 [Labilibaculum antarcticum]
MQHYITQLIEDLQEIVQKINPSGTTEEETIHDDESFSRHIEDVENYLHGEQIPISQITGIEQEQLPPPERLSEKQQANLAVELDSFLQQHHFALEFPQNYPIPLRYSFIRDFWTEKHPLMKFGTSHIEFCDYDPENCPFPGYCKNCDDFEPDDEDFDMTKYKKMGPGDLPF